MIAQRHARASPGVRRRSGSGRSDSAKAVMASLLIHLVVLAAFFIPRGAGALSSGQYGRGAGEGTGDAPAISLVLIGHKPSTAPSETTEARSSRPSAPAAKAQTAADALQRLIDKSLADTPKSPIAAPRLHQTQSIDAIIAAADKASKAQRPVKETASKSPSGSERSGQQRTAAATSSGGASGGAAGDLYAQVEPCWKRALGVSASPVTVHVVLNATGRLAGAPTVESVGENADRSARRISVERALQAIAACLPYHAEAGANAGRAYQVRFGISN